MQVQTELLLTKSQLNLNRWQICALSLFASLNYCISGFS